MQVISDSTKPVQSDLTRMTGSLNKMSNVFIGLATVGVGFFAGLARTAPAVAGAMAKIQVSMGELGRALGVALKPQFEFFADQLRKVSDFVKANPDLVGNITTGILLFGGALAGIKFFSFITGVNLLAVGFSALAGVLGLPVWITALVTLGAIALVVKNISDITKATGGRGGGTTASIVSTLEASGTGTSASRIFGNLSIGGMIARLFDAFSKEKDRSSDLMSYQNQSYG